MHASVHAADCVPGAVDLRGAWGVEKEGLQF
jgi:hypothetical protein